MACAVAVAAVAATAATEAVAPELVTAISLTQLIKVIVIFGLAKDESLISMVNALSTNSKLKKNTIRVIVQNNMMVTIQLLHE